MMNPLFEISSRDIWSHGSGTQLKDLLTSALSTLLLMNSEQRPVYISSPWVSDFPLFENRYQQFESLFPDLADQAEIYFSSYLKRLAQTLSVRIITTDNDISRQFLNRCDTRMIHWRFADDDYHEKGFLAPSFYIEGSMNFTYHGVNIREEKITYHTGVGAYGPQKILSAYLEFDRRWGLLGKSR